MRHVRLIAFEDEPTGSLGVGFKACMRRDGTPGPHLFADRSGELSAHDLLEHQNGFDRIGDVDDELMAIGAIWQVRGRHGTLLGERTLYRGLHESIAGDIENTANALDSMEHSRWWPRFGQYNTRPHFEDEEFEAILSHARPNVEQMVKDNEATFPVDAFFENALHLMRMGYRKAQRRWGDGWRGADTYEAVRLAVGRIAKHVDVPGDQFRLSYGNGEARCIPLLHADDAW